MSRTLNISNNCYCSYYWLFVIAILKHSALLQSVESTRKRNQCNLIEVSLCTFASFRFIQRFETWICYNYKILICHYKDDYSSGGGVSVHGLRGVHGFNEIQAQLKRMSFC